MDKYEALLKEAIKHFWKVRKEQDIRQGGKEGAKDYGNRRAVTGGAQLDGFARLFSTILKDHGLPEASIHCVETTLPGYYRPTKEWDLVIVHNKELVAAIEFKSQAGPSFGNNFNNRVEEAIGSATDLWTAYREGAFQASHKPWLGYFILLEKHNKSTSIVRLNEPHFKAFKEFRGTSYKDRYRILGERLVRERLYDAVCYMLSDNVNGLSDGQYEEPDKNLGFKAFSSSLIGKVAAIKSI